MHQLPEMLASGEIARLIPVIADSRKEQRVTSVFLATLSAIPSFAQALLAPLGQRLGKRSVVDTFTEIVLKTGDGRSDRPDGLIRISSSSKDWSALVEAKIGNAELDPDQVQRYLHLARENDLNAVVTISNQFVARSDHSPVNVPKTLTKRTSLYHWSWNFILTEAILQQTQDLVSDPEQAFILREFIRFLSHKSVDVSGFERMPAEWGPLNTLVKTGGSLKWTSPDIEAVVSAWHQEARDLALRMSRHLAANCTLKLSRAHAQNSAQWLRGDCQELASKETLKAEFAIPNAASPLSVDIDLKSQTIRVGMEIDAPQDKKSAVARVNWLLRQLSTLQRTDIFIRIIWPSRAQDLIFPLNTLKDDPKSALQGRDQVPRAFEVFLVSSDARRFAGRNTFIEEVERAVPTFYDEVGQHLQQWHPKPPKPVAEQPKEETASVETPAPPVTDIIPTAASSNLPAAPGNRHTEILETPDRYALFPIGNSWST